ncbi:MAG: 16S rRNA (cytosine(1402)-N(4))-methyltransferase RsmH [Lentimicrobiaceae bacterium]|nr:16S rRNA (cytosine(1402)-N(4))-methyltransferase RsmH [Lentimicrobiaceae bacterium]
MYHTPVMITESIHGLAIKPSGLYVDVTYGGGGHSAAILDKLGQDGRLLAFDQDMDALDNLPDDNRLTFINQNFSYLTNFLRLYKALPVDGILADLGVSSHQLDAAERGFSTRSESVLDLRMNRKAELTARQVVNQYTQEELTRVFRDFGELPNSWRMALTLVEARQANEIVTTGDLKQSLLKFARKGQENKFYARVFQALRIEVNGELNALKSMLEQSIKCIKPGGRLVVISYHSLEDRLVKHFMRSGNFGDTQEKDFFGNVLSPFRLIDRKAIVPTEDEIQNNPRARSARLRIAERTDYEHIEK